MLTWMIFSGWYFLYGWVFFFLAVLIPVIWVWYEARRRNLPASGWKTAISLVGILFLPTLYVVLTNDFLSMIAYGGIISVLGILSGIACIVMAIVFSNQFAGWNRPVPVSTLRQTRAAVEAIQAPAPVYIPAPSVVSPPPIPPVQQAKPSKPKANCWLLNTKNQSFQLNQGETTIGRSAENDIVISEDTTVSTFHAKIIEENGHFRVLDLGSTNGTRLNGNWVRKVELLRPGDQLNFGDYTVFKFVSPQ